MMLAATLPAAVPPPLPGLPPAAQGKPPLPPPSGKETADYLRALSLKQPFCSALVLGKRKQESRTWKIKLPHDGTGLWVAAHSPAKAAPAGDPGMPQLRQARAAMHILSQCDGHAMTQTHPHGADVARHALSRPAAAQQHHWLPARGRGRTHRRVPRRAARARLQRSLCVGD